MQIFIKLLFLLSISVGVSAPSFAGAAAGSCESIFSLNATSRARQFNKFQYYMNKLREAKELDTTAPFAIALRFLILTTTKQVVREIVPLDSLYLIHPISREAAVEKLQQRTKALQEIDIETRNNILDAELLAKHLPSKNPLMRAIKSDEGQYVVFDGNGRLVAIQNAFPDKNVNVEIDVYQSNSKLLQKILRKVRSMRGVMP